MDAEKSWYLVYTKPRQEQVALVNLERQNYITYLPYVAVNKRVSGVKQQAFAPMFPRYLFIQLSEKHDDWGPIRSTRGVAGLVRFGSSAAKVPAQLVEIIRQRESNAAQVVEPDFGVGDTVRIAEGIMQGYEGIIAEKNNKRRVTLLLNIIGQVAQIEVPVDSIMSIG